MKSVLIILGVHLVLFDTGNAQSPKQLQNKIQTRGDSAKVDTPKKAFDDILSGNLSRAIKRRSPGLKKSEIVEVFIFAKEGLSEPVHKQLHQIAKKHGADVDEIMKQLRRRKDVEDFHEEFANKVYEETEDVNAMLLDVHKTINRFYKDIGLDTSKFSPVIKDFTDLRIDGEKAVANATCLLWDYETPDDVAKFIEKVHFRRSKGFWMICTEEEWNSKTLKR